MFKRLAATATIIAASTAPAFAHVSADHGSLASGLAHPFSGADHLLAMVAVGLWAFQLGGRARFAVPASFVALMLAGFGLAQAGVALPFVEPAIAASVIGLGLLVALMVRVPVAAASAVVGVFALFHGHAHGTELASGSALGFGLGFVVSTALLHAAGLFGGLTLSRHGASARIAGGLTAAAGAALVLG